MPTRAYSDFSFGPEDPVAVKNVKKVAIIGGGASGAITLDSLVAENTFDEIVLYERRDVLGGIWVLDLDPIKTPADIVKPGRLSRDIDPPLKNPFADGYTDSRIRSLWTKQERFEQTPAYDGMATNIIEKLMTFSDQKQWLPEGNNKYVDRSAVRDYIDRYISRNKDKENVKLVLGTTVEDLEKVAPRADSDLPYLFKLTLRRRLQDGTDEWFQNTFDAVIVTVGHYHIPFIPEVPGLREFQEERPHAIQHAKFFRNAVPYTNKTVLVIGSRALGADLTKFSADTAVEVYQLIRNVEGTRRFSRKSNVTFKPIVTRYEKTDKGFNAVFSDGTVLENPDVVVYATGYQFLYPFLVRSLGDITLDGRIVPDLYQHTFLVKDPLITFVGVPTDAISFRAFEYQAILTARYLAGKVSLPPVSEQRKWLEDRFNEKGATRAYHTIGALDALDYVKTLLELGTIKDVSIAPGREFPELSIDEIEEYTAAGAILREFWDAPRIPE